MNEAALLERKFGRGSVPLLTEGAMGAVTQKWAPMLQGVQNPWRRRIIGLMLENQATYFNDVMTEEVRSNVVGNFLKIVFPMIRRAYAEIVAPELVSVQPLTAPIGGVAFYHPRYGTTKGGITAGDEMIINFDPNYSSERVTGTLIGVGDGSALVFSTNVKHPVRPATLTVYTLIPGQAPVLVGQADATGAITDAGAGIIAGGAVNNVTGSVTIVFTGANAPAAGVQVVTNSEYDMEGNPDIPEVRFDIQIVSIQAKPRKLKVLWSAEAEEDLRAMWGQDITTELVGSAAANMSLEVDREILQDLVGAALSGNNVRRFDAKATPPINLRDHLSNIIVPISQVSNLIHKRTLRGPANWIVTSTAVAALLEITPYFTSSGDWKGQMGIYKAGTLQGKWTVYVDPYFQDNLVLIGRQGTSMLDTGYVWAPYIALQVTGTFQDPGDQTMRKGLRTRYAKLMVRPEFYGAVIVDNLK